MPETAVGKHADSRDFYGRRQYARMAAPPRTGTLRHFSVPAMTEKEIAVLLGRIRESDELAFEALYRAFAPRVKAFVLVRLFSRDPDTVDEIVSDTFIAVWRSAGTFKEIPGSAHGSWESPGKRY